MPGSHPDRLNRSGKPAGRSADQPVGRTVRRRTVLGLAGLLGLVGLLSCGSPTPSTGNPKTLWVNFGQTELDLILVETEPPYY